MAVLFDALPFCTTNDKNAIEQKKNSCQSKFEIHFFACDKTCMSGNGTIKMFLLVHFVCACIYLTEWLVPFYCRKYIWILMILIVKHIFTNLFISFACRLSRRTFLFVWLVGILSKCAYHGSDILKDIVYLLNLSFSFCSFWDSILCTHKT